jgi:Protein of unknown function (DUF3631)
MDTVEHAFPELADVKSAFKDPAAQPGPLDVAREFLGRFVYASDPELDILTAWIAHTYIFEAYYATPRLAIMAPEPEAGKTTVLNMIMALGNKGIITLNTSAPALFAIIDQEHPTLLFDEVDNMWSATGLSSKVKDQLAILNNGYTQDGYVLRTRQGRAYKYPVFACAAFAGIGQLPATLASRCVQINMKRVPTNVTLEEYEPDLFKGEAESIARLLAEWLGSRGPEMDLQPLMPEGLRSRKKQIWKSLIGVGDLAGPDWSSRIRQASKAIALGISQVAHVSPAEELIALVASVSDADTFLPTKDLIDLLKFQRDNEDELGWATWLDNQMIAARQIANILRPYGIESEQKWLDDENRRGYNAGDFHAWAQAKRSKEVTATV